MEDINFFRRESIANRLIRSTYVRAFIFTLILNLVFILIFNYRLGKIRLDIEKLEFCLEENMKSIDMTLLQQEEAKFKELNYLEEESNSLLENMDKTPYFKNKIESIIAIVPLELFIEKIDLESKEIIIMGKSGDKVLIYEFYKSLRALDFANNSIINQISKLGDIYEFKITFQIR